MVLNLVNGNLSRAKRNGKFTKPGNLWTQPASEPGKCNCYIMKTFHCVHHIKGELYYIYTQYLEIGPQLNKQQCNITQIQHYNELLLHPRPEDTLTV